MVPNAPNNVGNEGYGLQIPTEQQQVVPQDMNPTSYPAQQENPYLYNPNFNGYVMPMQQQQPVYMNPAFNGLYKQFQSIFGQNYSFGNFVTVDEPNQQTTGLNINTLRSEPESISPSVGLSMNNSIINPTQSELETQQISTQPVAVDFNGLINAIDPRNITEKFGVQPIPVEYDRSMLPKAINPDDNAHLNKNNTVQQSIGRKVNNWFTRLLDQRGEDYISSGKLTVDEVSKNAERIIDDLIGARIDYSKQSQYIIHPIIIDTLINYCANKLAINRAIQFSLGYVYNDYTNASAFTDDPERLAAISAIDDSLTRNITQSIAIVNQDISVYDLLYKKLSYVKATNNASSLFSLPNELNNLKKSMKKRY